MHGFRDDLCHDCGHHLHRPKPGKCGWYDCPCPSVSGRAAALAEAVRATLGYDDNAEEVAAAVLAALDAAGWALVPIGTAAADIQAEIARLRSILALHNKTPTGRTRECLPGCLACAALEEANHE